MVTEIGPNPYPIEQKPTEFRVVGTYCHLYDPKDVCTGGLDALRHETKRYSNLEFCCSRMLYFGRYFTVGRSE
jgi:hypothetical protein